MLDQELSGEAIANEVIKKVNARLRFMYRQGRLAPVLKTVFFFNLILCLGASLIYILIASLILMAPF